MDTININIDAKRNATAPKNVYLLCDNSDQTVTFIIDSNSGFDCDEPITAVFVTERRGALPGIQFTGNTANVPVLSYADGKWIHIGLTQGDIKTSTSARIPLRRSIFSVANGLEVEPSNQTNALPVVSDVAIDDLVRISDVSDGRLVLATLRTLKNIIGGDVTAPYVGENGNWFIWNGEEDSFVDTGIRAEGSDGESAYQIAIDNGFVGTVQEWLDSLHGADGQDGRDGADGQDGQNGADGYSPAATVTKSGDTITISITDKNGTTSTTLTDIEDAVRYSAQSLSSEQKAQARTNIGAGTDSKFEFAWYYDDELEVWTTNVSFADWTQAKNAGNRLVLKATTIDSILYYDLYNKVIFGNLSYALFCAIKPTMSGGNISGSILYYFAFPDEEQYYRGPIVGQVSLAPLNSPAFTGTPTAPTAPQGTNSTQLATTAFVHNAIPEVPSASSATPNMDGTGSAGSFTAYARADHTHPTDTSRAAVTDLAAKADKPKYTTLTLAVADWETSGNAYACTKTVTGMTATSAVWLKYSNPDLDFSEAQGANTLTFTVASLPSAAVTVDVTFMDVEVVA